MKKIRLSIPEPCSEQRNSFTRTAQGGFCDKCQKEVIDFTGWNDARIAAHFQSNPSTTCGMLYKHQLKTYTVGVRDRGIQAWIPALLTGAAAMFISGEAAAQAPQSATKTEQSPVVRKDRAAAALPRIQITGSVTDISGKALPGINVVSKNPAEGMVTDANGTFTIDMAHSGNPEILTLSFIGMKTIAIPIPATPSVQAINVVMEADPDATNEDVVIGGCSPRSPIRRFWNRITNISRH